MRILHLIPWLLLVSFQANAQITLQFSVNQNVSGLIVNAGANTSIASGQQVMLGASPTVNGGTPPYQYSWSPSTGLSQTNVANPFAAPVKSIIYTLTVTDTKGCTLSRNVTITVDGIPAANFNSYQSSVKFFPNPAKGTVYISSDVITGKEIKVQLFNPQGIQVHEQWVNTSNGTLDTQIDLPEHIHGLFTIKISGDDLQVVKKILVE